MKLNLLLSAAMLAFGGLAAPSAQAVGRLADVTVIDRHSGATLPVHYHRGEYWVAGLPGGRYAVQVRNRTGERLMAVTSVDGVNVISGETAAVEQTGYVFDGYQRYEVTGWRKSNQEVAAFEFVASPASYAARTGRPANVGVIGVALFKERLYQPPVSVAPPIYRYGTNGGYDAPDDRKNMTAEAAADSASSRAAPAPSQSTPQSAKRSEFHAMREKLGTGHGEREWSQVTNTSFDRAQSSPNETIRIRYDSRENLLAMGVIQQPYQQRPWNRTPNAFPESLGFVPDPPRFWR